MSAREILRKLHEVGARIECRGRQLKLYAGRSPVSELLIEQVRASKPELMVLLENVAGPPKDAPTPSGTDKNPPEPAETLASLVEHEDARRCSCDEHLPQTPYRTPAEPSDTPIKPGEILASATGALQHDREFHAPKMLIEDAHSGAFDEAQHSRGVEPPKTPKVLIISEGCRDKQFSISQPSVAYQPPPNPNRGLPSEWRDGLSRLRPDHPPRDVPLRRWQQFIIDARRLVDTGVLARATEHGWTARDLFGCDREKPFARIDQMGLTWLIDGGRVLGMSRSAAVIRTASGAQQTFRRKPTTGQIPVWGMISPSS